MTGGAARSPLPVIPESCALDDAGQREQRARYARLAASVVGLEREVDALVVQFGPGLDLDGLEEALAVERECCPFFRFAFDDQRQRLTVTVEEARMLPALDAIEYGFRAG
jgi:hypothetical protein